MINLNQKLQFKDNDRILSASELPSTLKIHLNIGNPKYVIEITNNYNLSTKENIYVFRGIIKHNIQDNILHFPEFNFTNDPIMFSLTFLNLPFKEQWLYKTAYIEYDFNAYVNSLYELQAIVTDHFWTSLHSHSLEIANTSENLWQFNETFKKYCNLNALALNEQTQIKLKSKKISLDFGTKSIIIDRPPSINIPYKFTLNNSDPIKVKLINNILDQPITAQNIADTASIHITATQPNNNGTILMVTIKH